MSESHPPCVQPRVRVESVERGEGRVAAGHVADERLLLRVDPRVHLQAEEEAVPIFGSSRNSILQLPIGFTWIFRT